MVSSLLFFLFTPANLTPKVAVEAAYVLATYTPEQKCCGLCKNGVVTHGDGHVTPCSCPPECKCKAKTVTHPPSVLRQCPDGKCNLKHTK